MKYIKLFENFLDLESINEDFMELKSIVKQIYSALKNHGYEVEIEKNKKNRFGTTITDSLVGTKDSKKLNNKGGSVRIIQFLDSEQIGVFIPANAVAYQFIIDPKNIEIIKQLVDTNKPGAWDRAGAAYQEDIANNWNHVINDMCGQYGHHALPNDIQGNQQIQEFIQNLGSELLLIIQSNHPNMLLSFQNTDVAFAMYFAEPRTRKGAVVNPKQRPHKHRDNKEENN